MNLEYGLSSDTWDENELAALQRVIASGRYTMGEEVKKFEKEFAEFMGVKHAIMTNSGSSANLLMLTALKLHPKFDKTKTEVIVPAVSWSTTYFPVHQNGFKLKFVDINPNSFNIDLEAVANAITKDTAAVLAVNLLGNPAHLHFLRNLCEQHGVVLLEDNCESFGAVLTGDQCGTIGEMGTFSFFFSHHLQTMEGGMVVTNDDSVATYLKPLRAHGWIRDLEDENELCNKTGDPFEDSFKFVLPGYCVRPLEMSGAVGQEQLKKWPKMLEVRRNNAKVAQTFLQGENFVLQHETGESSWFGFGIKLINNLKGRRNEVIELLHEHGVETRPIVTGNFLRNPVIQHLNHVPCTPEEFIYADHLHYDGFFIGNDCVDLTDKIIAVSKLIKGLQ